MDTNDKAAWAVIACNNQAGREATGLDTAHLEIFLSKGKAEPPVSGRCSLRLTLHMKTHVGYRIALHG